MKFCSQCGAANEDTMFSCYSCGAPLEMQQVTTGRKRRLNIPKPVLTIGAIVTAAAVVVGGIVFAVSGAKGGIDGAASRTAKEFSGDEKNLTQAAEFVSVASKGLSKGEYTLDLAFLGANVDVQIHTDYSRSAKELRGEIELNEYGIEYSAKENIAQIRFPGEYEVYGFDVKDVNKITKKINELLDLPFLKDVVQYRLPTDLKMDLFKKTDLEKSLKNFAKDEVKAFTKSVKVEKWNSDTIVRAGKTETCRVYKISWKSSELNKLLNSLGGGFLPDVSAWLNDLLPELDPYLYCYVNKDGYFVGVRFTTAGVKCLLLLEGEENIWDEVVLTAETIDGEIRTYRGALERSGEDFELYLKNAAGEKQIIINYDDGDGKFTLWTAGVGTILEGRITCASGEGAIWLSWNSVEFGPQELYCGISELQNKPEQLGEKCSSLSKIGWEIMENILHDVLTN